MARGRAGAELVELHEEAMPAKPRELWAAPPTATSQITLKDSDPPIRATVEFTDRGNVTVCPRDVPSWNEDSNGGVITLEVAPDGLTATLTPRSVGKVGVTVTTHHDDGSTLQVTDLVSVVGGKPTHGVLRRSSGTVPADDGPPTTSSRASLRLEPVLSDDSLGIDQATLGASPGAGSSSHGASWMVALLRRASHHRVRLVLTAVALVVLAGVGYVFLSYELRSLPGAESIHAAVSTFKGGSRSTTNTNALYQPPEQGVYELRGQGTERISFPPNSMSDGAVMPASVTYLSDGCWRWHLDYNVAHWEEYDFCPRGAGLTQTGNRNSQTWDFGTLEVTNLASFTCPPNTVVLPDNPVAGQTLRWTCTGTNTSVKGKTTAKVATHVFGTVQLSIGKQTVKAVHEVQKTTLTGGQKGTVVENWWFSAKSGLPVHVQRQIKIVTASPLGEITYHEDGSWQMASLTPRT